MVAARTGLRNGCSLYHSTVLMRWISSVRDFMGQFLRHSSAMKFSELRTGTPQSDLLYMLLLVFLNIIAWNNTRITISHAAARTKFRFDLNFSRFSFRNYSEQRLGVSFPWHHVVSNNFVSSCRQTTQRKNAYFMTCSVPCGSG